jgi:hypothetical protein
VSSTLLGIYNHPRTALVGTLQIAQKSHLVQDIVCNAFFHKNLDVILSQLLMRITLQEKALSHIHTASSSFNLLIHDSRGIHNNKIGAPGRADAINHHIRLIAHSNIAATKSSG